MLSAHEVMDLHLLFKASRSSATSPSVPKNIVSNFISNSDSDDEFELPPPKRAYITLEYSNSQARNTTQKKGEGF